MVYAQFWQIKRLPRVLINLFETFSIPCTSFLNSKQKHWYIELWIDILLSTWKFVYFPFGFVLWYVVSVETPLKFFELMLSMKPFGIAVYLICVRLKIFVGIVYIIQYI